MAIDYIEYNQELLDKVAESYRKIFSQPVAFGKRYIRLVDVQPVFNEQGIFDPDVHREARTKNQTVSHYLKLRFEVVDKTKGTKKQRTVAVPVPVFTNRNTFIVNGNEYIGVSQIRRKPGVYVIEKDRGVVMAQFNPAFKANIDIELREDGLLYFKIRGATIPVLPVLRGFGVPESQIKRVLGPFYEKNVEKGGDPTAAIHKLHKLLLGEEAANADEAKERILEYLKDALMEKVVVQDTLGNVGVQAKHPNLVGINLDMILRAIQKVTRIATGKEKPDNPNDLAFKNFFRPIDLLAERVLKTKDLVISRLRHGLYSENPEQVLTTDTLYKPVITFFTATSLVKRPEQSNPLDWLVASKEVTPLGEGGIESADRLPHDARALDDSHWGILDPVFTPSSRSIGLSLRFTKAVDPQKLTIQVIKAEDYLKARETGRKPKLIEIPIQEYLRSTVTTVDLYERGLKKKKKQIYARDGKDRKLKFVPIEQIQYLIPPANAFSESTAFIPGIHFNHGVRAQMGAKMLTQAVPLKEPEPPLVDTLIDEKTTAAEELGKQLAVTAPEDGVVKEIDEKKRVIRIKTDSGKTIEVKLPSALYLNSDVALDTRAILVKPGQKVRKGDVLADVNYTVNGELAVGKNLLVAYVPYKGLTNRDGVVISESAAKKLTSVSYYRMTMDKVEGQVLSKSLFASHYPSRFTSKQLAKLDNDGVVRKGQTVEPGDPLIVSIRYREPTPDERILGMMLRNYGRQMKAEVLTWDKPVKGEVVDVIKTPTHITVVVRAEEPAQVGDKLALRHGEKGVITAIIPDSKMPRLGGPDGPVPDVLISPLAVPSRLNPGQLAEVVAGKIAEKADKEVGIGKLIKKGDRKKIAVPPFGFQAEDLLKEAEKLGIKEREVIWDPEYGRELGEVFAGPAYVLKLKHKAEKAISARSAGPIYPYSQLTMTPSKGGKKGAKELDILTQYALLAHGAKEILKESHTYKSDVNEAFWKAIHYGLPVPPPQPTYLSKKFSDMLRILGLDMRKINDDTFKLMFLDDEEVAKLAKGRKLWLPYRTFRATDLKPEPGGIFDPNLTGGFTGDRYTYMQLPFRIPNPAFVRGIAALLEVSERDIPKIIKGEKELPGYGSGNDAIIKALRNIGKNLDQIIAETCEAIENEQDPNKRAKLRAKLRYLEALKETGKDPVKAYTTSKVLVIPPRMRPVIVRKDGSLIHDDLNTLYRNLGAMIDAAAKTHNFLPPKYKNEVALGLYNILAQLQGLQMPSAGLGRTYGVVKTFATGQKEQGQPKHGFIQARLISKKQDFSGRAVLSMDLNLDIDEVILPERMAWDLYRPFIIQNLISKGFSALEAEKEWEERTEAAKRALEEEVQKRPVLVNRDPALHKYSVYAMKVRLSPDITIKIHPLVYKGLGADLDGDQVNIYLPVTDKAVEEAKKLFPSRNVIKLGHAKPIILPEEDTVIGLWNLTKEGPKGRAVDVSELLEGKARELKPNGDFEPGLPKAGDLLESLIKAGKVSPSQAVKINGKTMSAGQAVVWLNLPEEVREYLKFPLNDDNIKHILKQTAVKHPELYSRVVLELERLGDEFSYYIPVTIDLSSSLPSKDVRNKIKQKLYLHQQEAPLANEGIKDLEKKKSPIWEMIISGARGSKDVLKHFSLFIGKMPRPDGTWTPEPIKFSYAEGLPPADYWMALYEARQGLITQQTAVTEPGAVTKEVLPGLLDVSVTYDDAPDPGIEMDVDDDILGRFLAKDVKYGKRTIMKKGTQITEEDLQTLKKYGIKKVWVRSPISVLTPGITIPVKSFGTRDDGRLPEQDEPIGVEAAHALTEPLTQLVLKAKHLGVDVKMREFNRIKTLLELPHNSKEYAIHSPVSGTVVEVKKQPSGNWIVVINKGKDEFITIEIPRYHKPTVKAGDKVEAGDQITDGVPNYHEVAQYTNDLIGLRRKWVEDLHQAYKNAGIKLGKRWIEVVAKRIFQNAELEDPGTLRDLGFAPGDVVDWSLVDLAKKETEKTVTLDYKHIGLYLAEDRAPFKRGTLITKDVVDKLKGKKVKVTGKIKAKPVVKGFPDIVLEEADRDLLTAALAGRIKDTILTTAPSAPIIDVQKTIPSLVFNGW